LVPVLVVGLVVWQRSWSPTAVEGRDAKRIVQRWVDCAINNGDLDAAAELCTPRAGRRTRAWVAPFREAFPDVRMETVELVAEGDSVAGRFVCSATHRGTWQEHEPTGRRFERVDEVYIFHFEDGLIADFWGIEDAASRLRQLGLPLD
jgi:predicted ester cyclase